MPLIFYLLAVIVVRQSLQRFKPSFKICARYAIELSSYSVCARWTDVRTDKINPYGTLLYSRQQNYSVHCASTYKARRTLATKLKSTRWTLMKVNKVDRGVLARYTIATKSTVSTRKLNASAIMTSVRRVRVRVHS